MNVRLCFELSRAKVEMENIIKNIYTYFPKVEFINHSYCQHCSGEAKHLVETPLTFRYTQVFIRCSFPFQMALHSVGIVLSGAFEQ